MNPIKFRLEFVFRKRNPPVQDILISLYSVDGTLGSEIEGERLR